jgi:hypothetical protein
MMREKGIKNVWITGPESPDQARTLIKQSAIAFYFVGFLNMAIGLAFFPQLATEGISYVILGFLFHFYKSRAAAVLLLLLSLSAVVVTGINRFTSAAGGKNILLAAAILFCAVRAAQAVFVLHKKTQMPDLKRQAKRTILGGLCFLSAGVLYYLVFISVLPAVLTDEGSLEEFLQTEMANFIFAGQTFFLITGLILIIMSIVLFLRLLYGRKNFSGPVS